MGGRAGRGGRGTSRGGGGGGLLNLLWEPPPLRLDDIPVRLTGTDSLELPSLDATKEDGADFFIRVVSVDSMVP